MTVLSAARPPESVTSRRNTQVPAAGRVTLATALSADWMLTGVPETSVQLQPTMLLPPTPVLALPSSVTVLPALTCATGTMETAGLLASCSAPSASSRPGPQVSRVQLQAPLTGLLLLQVG